MYVRACVCVWCVSHVKLMIEGFSKNITKHFIKCDDHWPLTLDSVSKMFGYKEYEFLFG